MDKLKQMKECMIGIVEGQIYGNIDKVDAQELGAAVDIIKDLSEAIYYCTITEAMEGDEQKSESKHRTMYSTRVRPVYDAPIEMYDPRYRDRTMYAGNGGEGGGASSYRAYPDYPRMYRDPREGRSGERRKMYMQGKDSGKDKNAQMKELESYMQELSQDMTEMIQDASPEEKQLLQQKISTLASKIK